MKNIKPSGFSVGDRFRFTGEALRSRDEAGTATANTVCLVVRDYASAAEYGWTPLTGSWAGEVFNFKRTDTLEPAP